MFLEFAHQICQPYVPQYMQVLHQIIHDFLVLGVLYLEKFVFDHQQKRYFRILVCSVYPHEFLRVFVHLYHQLEVLQIIMTLHFKSVFQMLERNDQD